MKLHLPKLLRVVVIAAAMSSSVAVSKTLTADDIEYLKDDETTPDVKEGVSSLDLGLVTEVGVSDITHVWDGDLTIGSVDGSKGDVDWVGTFDSSGNFIQLDNNPPNNYRRTENLRVNGALLVQGEGEIIMGGQNTVPVGDPPYIGLYANSITMTGGHIKATKFVTDSLYVTKGTIETSTGNCTSGNGYFGGPKQSLIRDKIEQSGGSITFGYNNAQGVMSSSTHRGMTAFGDYYYADEEKVKGITITQSGGNMTVWGNSMAQAGFKITQSDAAQKMIFRDCIYLEGSGKSEINQSSDTATLVIGRFDSTHFYDKEDPDAGKHDIVLNQTGKGKVYFAYGSSFKQASKITIKQSGGGIITFGGGHNTSIVGTLPKKYTNLNQVTWGFKSTKTTYDINQTSGTITLKGNENKITKNTDSTVKTQDTLANLVCDGVSIGGKLEVLDKAKLKAATFELLSTGSIKVAEDATFSATEVTLISGSSVTSSGIFTVGSKPGSTKGGLSVSSDGTLNLMLDGTNAALTISDSTVTGWSMSEGSTLGIGFTSAYLNGMQVVEANGVKTYDLSSGVLVAKDGNGSVDLNSLSYTLAGLDDNYWKWSSDTALTEDDATGDIKLTGKLSFNPWVEVGADNDHVSYGDDETGGKTGIIIKENVSLDGDNSHSLGTKIVGAEVELGHEDALGRSESVTTSGTSLLSTADGVTANLPSVITVTEGDLTIKGSYEAADGVLDEGLSQGAAYFCVDGNEGGNGFYRAATDEAHKVVDVMQGATLNVDALDNVLVTVDGKEYQLYDDGLAGAKLDYSEYHMNTEEHAVAAREILDAGTADTKVLMGADAGTLTADTAIEVDADGGTVKTTADAEVSGSLDDVAIVAEGGKISATIGEASSVRAQAGETTITGANSYTGDTVIDKATLVVGHADALGDSSIVLQNQGVLDMGGYAVSNDLLVTGCTIKGAGAYTGNMTIQNPTRLDDATTATSVKLEKAGGFTGPGSLTTGSLEVATDTDASIEGSLTINDNGTVTLNDGKVLMVNGSLTLDGATTLALNGDYAVGDKLLTGNDSLEEGSITLVYNDSTVELERIGNSIVLVSKFKQDKADMAAQANWGIATASRAFVNAVRGQHSHTGCIANGRGTVWAAVLGAYNDMDGADISVQGAAVGVDAKLGRRSTVGIAAGYTDGEVSPAGLRDVDQEGNYVALYGEHGLKKLNGNSCLSLDWVAAYGQTESKAAGLKWEQDSLQLNTRLNWNKKVTDRLCMSVFGGLEYFASESDTSQGVKSGSIQNLRGEVGVGARYVAWGVPTVTDGKGGLVRPGCEKLVLNGEIRYFNDMVRSNPVIEMDGLRGDGENPGRQGVGIEAGATYRIGDRWSASANYSFNAMEDSTEHRVNVGASYTF